MGNHMINLHSSRFYHSYHLRGLKMKTEKEFSKTLRQLLLWKYNGDSIKDTLRDYEEYFVIGKSVGKSEERICAELGSPLAIVREVSIQDEHQGFLEHILNKKAMIRLGILIALIALFIVSIYKGDLAQAEYKKTFIMYPMIGILGWHILGGKFFSLAWIGQVTDHYKIFKITILHSIYLVMAIVSLILMVRVFSSWDVIYAPNDGYVCEMEISTIYTLVIVMMITIGIMLVGIYEYRCYGIEYFSVVCHGIGLLCTLSEYINVLGARQYWRLGVSVILHCEGVYVESLIFSSLFLIYSQYIKK